MGADGFGGPFAPLCGAAIGCLSMKSSARVLFTNPTNVWPPGPILPSRIRADSDSRVVTMYNYHPCRLAKSNIEKQYFSHCVNDVNDGSPSRILKVLRISFGMTILPRSSTRRTMPVAFISIPLLVANSQWYCLLKMPVYAGRKQDQEKPHPICSSNAVRFSSKKITGHMCMADRAEAMA